jgi:hypothetical protein
MEAGLTTEGIFGPNVSTNKVNNIPGWKNVKVFTWLFIGFP